jgi:hypothetical protein
MLLSLVTERSLRGWGVHASKLGTDRRHVVAAGESPHLRQDRVSDRLRWPNSIQRTWRPPTRGARLHH